jgi:rare lipoprotein A
VPPTAPPTTAAPAPTNSETGQASWYNAPAGYCAHPTLPLGTVITVTNLANGATATCTIEGRGPYGGGDRIVDLDQTTFAKLAPLSQGVINVRITW